MKTGPKIKCKKLWNKNWLEKQLKNKTVRQIAKELAFDYSGIHYAIRKLNIVVPKRTKYVLTVNKSEAIKSALRKKYPNGRNGTLSSNWRGGRRQTQKGYVYIYSPEHPFRTKEGYVMEHRLVMEKHLNRYLTKNEIVHHINGIKSDNSLENLEYISERGLHTKQHFKDSFKVRKLEEENLKLKQELKILKKIKER